MDIKAPTKTEMLCATGAVFLLLTLPCVANAASWVFVDYFTQVDSSSIVRSSQYTKVWGVLLNHSGEDKRVAYTKVQFYLHCGERNFAIKQALLYDSGTNFLGEEVVPDSQIVFRDPAPDSLGESVLKFVCAGKLADGFVQPKWPPPSMSFEDVLRQDRVSADFAKNFGASGVAPASGTPSTDKKRRASMLEEFDSFPNK